MSSAPFYIQQFLLSEVTERARWQDHASLSLHFANRRQPTNTASGEMWGHRPDPSYLCGPGQQVCAERLPHPRAGARAVNWPFQQKPPGPRGQRVQGGGEGRLFTEGGRLVCCWKACGEAATLLCVRSAASRLSQCHRGPPV